MIGCALYNVLSNLVFLHGLIDNKKSTDCIFVKFQNGVGMTGPLVDSEGFPISNIDVYQVRHARHRIICKAIPLST